MSNKIKPNDIIDLQSLIPDLVVDLAYASENNFTGQIVPGYEDNIAYLTTVSAQRLKLAQEEANSFGLSFKIFDTYRPIRAVDFFYDTWRIQPEDIEVKNRFYPDLSKEDLFAIGYVATRSSHSRASTADLTLIDLSSGEELDMGTEFDYFGEPSHTAFQGITFEQKKNRLLLKSLMEKYGFVNYKNEWWHFRLDNEPYKDGFDFPIKKAPL